LMDTSFETLAAWMAAPKLETVRAANKKGRNVQDPIGKQKHTNNYNEGATTVCNHRCTKSQSKVPQATSS